jgi:hypothetical protein
MSDHITVDGKKYFEESYLQLAINNTRKAREELEQWKTWGVVEIAVRNPNVASYMDHWEKRATEAEEENNKLRGLLAKGQGDCVYCGLPAEDIAKCKSGFPGCARMDDIVNAPEKENDFGTSYPNYPPHERNKADGPK